MIRLLRLEFRKMFSYIPFRVIIGLYALLFLGICLLLANIRVGGEGLQDYFGFGEVWRTTGWIASFFNLLPGILVIILTGNEFSYGTFRQQYVCGLSKKNFLAGKALMLIVVALFCFIWIFLVSFVLGLFFSYDFSPGIAFTRSYFLFLVLFQIAGYLTVSFFIAVLIRNNGLSVLILIGLIWLANWTLGMLLPVQLTQFLPGGIFNGLTPYPAFTEFISLPNVYVQGSPVGDGSGGGISGTVQYLLASVYICLFLVFSFVLVSGREFHGKKT